MKIFVYSLWLLTVLITSALSKETYGSVVVSKVVSIYDGDTFKVNIEGYPAIVGEKMSVRVNGIDTPEIRGKCAQEKELAHKAKQIVVELMKKAKVVELRNMQRDKYFRIVSDVYIDGKNLSFLLIEKNLAVVYDGGTKTKNWCE
ncbi:MAG: thermonuclease family protein [Arcobacteraceae bacterium]